MAAKFKPYKILSTELESLDIVEGQFIFTTDTKSIYIDNATERILVNSGSVADISATNNQLTITKNDGSTNTLTIDDITKLPLTGGTLTGSLKVNSWITSEEVITSKADLKTMASSINFSDTARITYNSKKQGFEFIFN